ncbi:site-specific DNA-methyltransferase [Pseudomonas aeruginosa]|uniref:site-specific DNA-methyltransferase n=1 Tax=Pseudomonadota TaxID=1224 RepID=UPI0002903B40|nr:MULTISPECIES: site-specific DNA-methyltransferase [Pseudomonadota]MBX6675782.1 site-specific DNA-methyltransferase [Pseudomonas aeruginosa]WQE88813.1 site-specific DNA-methyltransferase [Pseudomonas aeruginosa]CCN21684.1 Adenine specific DNA methylase Mod [Bordetella bronchiseptica 1289]CUJ02369.1 Modification methylase MboII [Achromobacter sp. 2789STDY5608621]HBN9520358.1 site-specific DNA-methyltransferase [Pseudomonas aeruginosa]
MSKQKLELTWIGKEKRPKLEPRILLEDPDKSYHAKRRVTENDIFDNRLIFGDNLLALKALEYEFTGRVRCIYIDPPYNTGSAFAQYEDGLEHSIWLGLIRERLTLLRNLLSKDGSCWIQLDDNEAQYCKVLADEIFGRDNFIANVVWNKSYAVRSNAQFFSSAHEHILVYAKDRAHLRLNQFGRSAKQTERYSNPDNDPRGPWQSVTMTISLVGGARGRQYAKTGVSENIFEVKSPSGKVFLPPPNRCWSRNPSGFKKLDAEGRIYWGTSGENAPRLKMYLSEAAEGVMPTTLWADGAEFGHNQDGIRELRALDVGDFPTPKPEKLISQVISLASDPGDIVLDSFAGSGTTGAVAHKMGRRWLMVELGEHCHTHILPRLRKVIDGEDGGGVTESVGWEGGGGFRYYSLAPSLIINDRWGNPVINPEYNAAQLAEALAKLEGFSYAPSEVQWWQHGHSSERDFIYVTTQNLSADQLQALSDEVGSDRSLLVCCAAFHGVTAAKANERWPNLTLKKIPKMVLARCEWGHDDYSLNVANLPMAKPDPVETSAAAEANKKAKSRKVPAANSNQGGLFGENE